MSKSGTDVTKDRHPGSGRGSTSAHTKGRQVDAGALMEVRSVLGDRPRRRDLLIEHLHLIQDEFGCLSVAHLAALADEMGLALAEVYEVATFYAHFDVLREGESPPPPVTVRVCDSVSCALHQSETLLEELEAHFEGAVRVIRAPCMGGCDVAPVVAVGHAQVPHATVESVVQAVTDKITPKLTSRFLDFGGYWGKGGYDLLRSCLAGRRPAEEIIALMESSDLRGLGGAGFPAGRKWRLVAAEPKPRYVVLNADEGEPGTFKDRFLLERNPHRVLEGMLLAAWAVDAKAAYIYIRDEYPVARELLMQELAKVEMAGLTRQIPIIVRRGAGAYICGEESAMLESIEGKRGLPRHRPPFPAQVGLFGRPTLIHNVETVFWVRDIIERGPNWFGEQGKNGGKGMRGYSVSGRVKDPGVKFAPAGTTVRELIDEHCSGMADGHEFKAYLPGGASGGILPASMADLPLDFGTLDEYGCFVGSAAIVVLSDKDNMGDVAINLLRFFEDESCGQCTPCRVGCEKAVKLMEGGSWDEALLRDLSQVMRDASICGLGQAAPNPLLSVLKHFPEDVR